MSGKWMAISALTLALVCSIATARRDAAWSSQWQRVLADAAERRPREICRAVAPPFAPKGIACVRYWTGPKP